MTFDRVLALVQGVYFFLTGVWPILHIRSFMAVTGPKHDVWLVKTVGALIAVVGGAILRAGWRGAVSAEVVVLAAGSAAALMLVDVIYVSKRVISKIYLADAVPEAVIVAAWCWVTWGMTR
jgi:hypothetical protein